jgi:hypothetical protein
MRSKLRSTSPNLRCEPARGITLSQSTYVRVEFADHLASPPPAPQRPRPGGKAVPLTGPRVTMIVAHPVPYGRVIVESGILFYTIPKRSLAEGDASSLQKLLADNIRAYIHEHDTRRLY